MTDNPDLFLPAPRARRTDPATSHAAAASMVDGAKTHAGRILAAFRTHGPGTYADAATWTGLTGWQVTKRIPELVTIGKLRILPETQPSPSGRDATVYEAT